MIKKKKHEIDVNNINSSVINYFYKQIPTPNDSHYKLDPSGVEICDESIDYNIEHISENLQILRNLQKNETIEINAENVNSFIIEYFIMKNEVQKNTISTDIIDEKRDKKLFISEENTCEINERALEVLENTLKVKSQRRNKDNRPRVKKPKKVKEQKDRYDVIINGDMNVTGGTDVKDANVNVGMNVKDDTDVKKDITGSGDIFDNGGITDNGNMNIHRQEIASETSNKQDIASENSDRQVIAIENIDRQDTEELKLKLVINLDDKVIERQVEEKEDTHFVCGREAHIKQISADKRMKYFLKRANPHFYKKCNSINEYIEETENFMCKKGEINYANQEKLKKKIKNIVPKYCNMKFTKETYWTRIEKEKFQFLYIKHKNLFHQYYKELSTKTCKELIFRYYNNKNKTFDYIKKKTGKLTDLECSTFINGTWTEEEKVLFDEKFSTFGKNIFKYQEYLAKSIKELKIYLRMYIKNTKKKITQKNTFLLDNWSIDERQIFAIYYPYFNKNWIKMSEHFANKTSTDLKNYYMKYYKNLKLGEQKFESYLTDYHLKSRTDPVLHIGERSTDWCDEVGWIFKAT